MKDRLVIKAWNNWLAKIRRQRGKRALERQLDFQEKKAHSLKGTEQDMAMRIIQRSQFIRGKLEGIRPISKDAHILEVGCGAHGLIFGFGTRFGVGIDPLAVEYKRLFPVWQGNAQTVSAIGENLPFEDSFFEVVLSDNVIDHAENPIAVVEEFARVLKPGGLLYFTVNCHHPIYQIASNLHGIWNAIGVKLEITPFADHTIHFTDRRLKSVFDRLPFDIVKQNSTVEQLKKNNRRLVARGFQGRFRKAFFKNALYEVTALRK